MERGTGKLVFWAPRVLVILFALFLFMFSFDVFEPSLSLGMMMLAFFMHNIPSLVLAAVLVVSWKRELVGAIFFIILGAACAVWFVAMIFAASGGAMNPMPIIGSVVGLLIGFLFLAGWRQNRKR